ncbi:MAG: tRNA pseudouridine(13) synthase TruD [Thermoproteota archaeon]
MFEHRGLRLIGKIKKYPEDFIVEEIWEDYVCSADFESDKPRTTNDIEREYLHFTMVKRNWNTVKALALIARKLEVSLKRFGIAGLKDKRAITSQRVSVWRVREGELARLNLPEIYLKDFSYSDCRINLGDALGNRFTVTIREIPLPRNEISPVLEAFGEYVCKTRIPNYFGSQRIGKGRDNAKIGQAIKEGELKKAVNILVEKVKTYIEVGRIEDIPDIFWIEKRVLNHLRERPNDYAGALRRIPKKILRIFPSAFQSRIFNEKLAKAIATGDVPEYIEVEGFDVEKIPELRTCTMRRNSYMNVKDFEILKVFDGGATIRFKLSRGEYATTFLSHLLDEVP